MDRNNRENHSRTNLYNEKNNRNLTIRKNLDFHWQHERQLFSEDTDGVSDKENRETITEGKYLSWKWVTDVWLQKIVNSNSGCGESDLYYTMFGPIHETNKINTKNNGKYNCKLTKVFLRYQVSHHHILRFRQQRSRTRSLGTSHSRSIHDSRYIQSAHRHESFTSH